MYVLYIIVYVLRKEGDNGLLVPKVFNNVSLFVAFTTLGTFNGFLFINLSVKKL